mmetsp:Transcript_62958/g.147782  ORF Transcript_62958/g.147782 Transcript_62958/m.147782 type:complete len:209 (+) Transcript_62958:265-891(+)
MLLFCKANDDISGKQSRAAQITGNNVGRLSGCPRTEQSEDPFQLRIGCAEVVRDDVVTLAKLRPPHHLGSVLDCGLRPHHKDEVLECDWRRRPAEATFKPRTPKQAQSVNGSTFSHQVDVRLASDGAGVGGVELPKCVTGGPHRRDRGAATPLDWLRAESATHIGRALGLNGLRSQSQSARQFGLRSAPTLLVLRLLRARQLSRAADD